MNELHVDSTCPLFVPLLLKLMYTAMTYAQYKEFTAVCVCVSMCVCEGERGRERGRERERERECMDPSIWKCV